MTWLMDKQRLASCWLPRKTALPFPGGVAVARGDEGGEEQVVASWGNRGLVWGEDAWALEPLPSAIVLRVETVVSCECSSQEIS